MADLQDFAFRSSLAYVTDGATVQPFYSTTGTFLYPQGASPSGMAAGWLSSTNLAWRDRSTTIDHRLAGINYIKATTTLTFRVDLPAAGTYPISLALGDPSNAITGCLAKIYDGATLLATIGPLSVAAGHVVDATGTTYTDAAWPGSNTPVNLTFAGTEMLVVLGDGNVSDTTPIAFLGIGPAAGGGGVTGTLAVTQANQTLSGAASATVTGTLAATQAAQTLSAAASATVAGTLATTQGANTLVAAASSKVVGTLSATQAAQTLSAAGTVGSGITGTLAATQAAQTLSAAGAVAVAGTLAATQAAQTLSAAGKVAVAGTLAATQAAQTLSAAGKVAVVGALAATQAAQTLSAAGTVKVVGTLGVTQAAQTLVASASVLGSITGHLAVVQQPNWTPAPIPVRRGSLRRGPLLYTRSMQPVFEGGAPAYVQQELGLVQQSSASIASYAPQPALAEPPTPQDATIRLARKPWWPVTGQTADAWVYYDAAGAVWRLLGTPPTTT